MVLAVLFEGRLKTSSEAALAELRDLFASDGLAPLLQDGTGGEVRLVLIPETEALVQEPDRGREAELGECICCSS